MGCLQRRKRNGVGEHAENAEFFFRGKRRGRRDGEGGAYCGGAPGLGRGVRRRSSLDARMRTGGWGSFSAARRLGRQALVPILAGMKVPM